MGEESSLFYVNRYILKTKFHLALRQDDLDNSPFFSTSRISASPTILVWQLPDIPSSSISLGPSFSRNKRMHKVPAFLGLPAPHAISIGTHLINRSTIRTFRTPTIFLQITLDAAPAIPTSAVAAANALAAYTDGLEKLPRAEIR